MWFLRRSFRRAEIIRIRVPGENGDYFGAKMEVCVGGGAKILTSSSKCLYAGSFGSRMWVKGFSLWFSFLKRSSKLTGKFISFIETTVSFIYSIEMFLTILVL